MTIIDKLRELEAKATPGEWRRWWFDGVTRTIGAGEPHSHVQIMEIPAYILNTIPASELDANAALIAAMRNALPALLRVVEAAKRYRDLGRDGGNPRDVVAAWKELDAALAALEVE